jgi:Tol biopolymer transport system component
MRMTTHAVTMLAAVASVVLTLGCAGAAGATAPGQNGKIAFVSNQDGDDEIYSIDPDGSRLTQLTDNATTDGAPAWSPDGQRIAFTSYRDGNYEIYVMGADGSNPTRLTTDAGGEYGPAWSPDGQRIAFASTRGNNDGSSDIYVMGADGSNPTRLTVNADNDSDPAWSPDGQKIAFASNRAPYGPDAEIFVMGADGSNPTALTNNATADGTPAWSLDGQRIAFMSNRDGGLLDFDLYVMGADGSNPTRLTTNAGYKALPAWSPDGQKIAFVGVRADGQKVRVINTDGSGETPLTSGPTPDHQHESSPDWQSLPPAQVGPTAGPQPGSGLVAADRRPLSRIALKARVVVTRSWRNIAGTARDDHAIARVQVSIVRRVSIDGRLRCRALTARAHWRAYRPTGRSCAPRFLLRARGTTKWSLRLKRRTPRGAYTITTRATDNAGQRETRFSTKLGNRRTVRAR